MGVPNAADESDEEERRDWEREGDGWKDRACRRLYVY